MLNKLGVVFVVFLLPPAGPARAWFIIHSGPATFFDLREGWLPLQAACRPCGVGRAQHGPAGSGVRPNAVRRLAFVSFISRPGPRGARDRDSHEGGEPPTGRIGWVPCPLSSYPHFIFCRSPGEPPRCRRRREPRPRAGTPAKRVGSRTAQLADSRKFSSRGVTAVLECAPTVAF